MRRSGETPSRNQERPSCEIATWVCVRGFPAKEPTRTALQLAQAQFHWGNAPPAAEPRIFTFISASLQPGVHARSSFGGTVFAMRDDRTCNLFTNLRGRV